MKNHDSNSSNLIHLPQKNLPREAPLGFGDVLIKYRRQADMSQSQLADLMDTSRITVSNWETGKFKPGYDQLRDLSAILHIPSHELLGISGASLPSAHEGVVLNQYRQLSSVGRRVIDKMVSEMLMEELSARDELLRTSYFVIPYQATPAAAGPGCEFNTVKPEPYFVKKNSFNSTADSLIRVSGQSMEPLYHDGDLVYIQFTDTANEEDDVVCSTADGAVIKRLRNHRLNSLNPKFPYASKGEDDNVRIVGRVLGVVEQDEIPDEADSRELEDLLHDQLMDFYEKYGE